MFNERESWITILTIFKTSSIAKSLPKDTRVALEELYRQKFCPSINHKEWLEIEQNIIQLSKNCINESIQLMLKAMGHITPNSQELEQIKTLEHAISLKDINIINIIKTFSPNSKISENTTLNQLVSEIQAKIKHDGNKK